MPPVASPTLDNRRALVRVVAHEALRGLNSLARLHGGDIVAFLVFTGIWALNTQHLIGEGERYAALRDIPPDSQRRPASPADLLRLVSIPEPLLLQYVDQMVEQGIIERVPGGLVAPSAVFTQPEMLDGANEVYVRLIAMVTGLRDVGFSFGETA